MFDKISDNEWLVMEILWRDGEIKSSIVTAELEKSKGWASETVRTFLKRLITKGVVAARQDENDKRAYWYYATVSKDDYVAYLTRGHLKRYYSGCLPQLVAGLLDNECVSDQELNEIEIILKRYTKREG